MSGTGEEFPESFAGTAITDNGVAVFSVAPDADMREAIVAFPNPDGFTVAFVEVANTFRSLMQLTNAITDGRQHGRTRACRWSNGDRTL